VSTTNNIGFEDIGFAVLWDARDEKQTDRILHKIRTGELPADTLENKLYRYYNDQTVDIEPIEMTDPKGDLTVNSGLIRIAQLVTGKSNATFNSYASGTGIAAERASDVRLSSENWRVSMISSGYVESVGTVMKFAGKFPTTTPSATITEGGVFDTGAANSGTMLFRTLYPSSAIFSHQQGKTYYSLLQSINQVSVT
jgi:hypothetical protein